MTQTACRPLSRPRAPPAPLRGRGGRVGWGGRAPGDSQVALASAGVMPPHIPGREPLQEPAGESHRAPPCPLASPSGPAGPEGGVRGAGGIAGCPAAVPWGGGGLPPPLISVLGFLGGPQGDQSPYLLEGGGGSDAVGPASLSPLLPGVLGEGTQGRPWGPPSLSPRSHRGMRALLRCPGLRPGAGALRNRGSRSKPAQDTGSPGVRQVRGSRSLEGFTPSGLAPLLLNPITSELCPITP